MEYTLSISLLFLYLLSLVQSDSCDLPDQKWLCGSCTLVDTRDCAGMCPVNNAPLNKIDCTGACKPVNQSAVYDLCGVCGGDLSTCLDCNSVINGTAQLDGCNICGGTGTTCGLQVLQVSPRILPNEGSPRIDVFGTGFSPSSPLLLRLDAFNLSITATVVSTSEAYFVLPSLAIPQIPESPDDVITQPPLDILPLQTDLPDVIVTEPSPDIPQTGSPNFFATQVATRATISQEGTDLQSQYELVIYDVAYHVITNFQPPHMYAGQSQLLFFSIPATLNASSTGACFFNISDPPVSSQLEYIDNATLACRTPIFTDSGFVQVKLMYDTPQARVAWNSSLFLPAQLEVILIVKENASVPLAAQFIDAGSTIVIQFSTDMRLVNAVTGEELDPWSIWPCSAFLAPPSESPAVLWRPGEEKDCSARFETRSRMVLSIHSAVAQAFPQQVVRPGSTLYFLPNSLYSKDKLSDSLTQSIQISAGEASSKRFNPVGPAVVNSCSDLGIEIGSSVTLGRGPYQNASFMVVPDQRDKTDKALDAYLKILSVYYLDKAKRLLTIPLNILTARSYSFSFALSSTYEIAQGTLTVQKSVNENIPQISLRGPILIEDISVSTYVYCQVAPPCGSFTNSIVNLEWNGPNKLLWRNATASILVLEPYTLAVDSQYGLSIMSWYSGFPSTSAKLVLKTGPERLWAFLGNRTLGFENAALSILFRSSSSPSPSLGKYEIKWYCFNDQHLPCQDLSASSPKTLSLPNGNFIDLAKKLKTGSYVFYVKITHRISLISASSPPAFVNITVGIAPIVDFSFNPNEIRSAKSTIIRSIVNQGSIKGSLSQLQFVYTVVSGCDGQLTRSLNASDPLVAMTTQGVSPSIRFHPNTLLPGAKYCIELQVTDPFQKNSGRIAASFSVPRNPALGNCSIQSASPTLFGSTFEFQCYDFASSVDQMILHYSWELLHQGTEWYLLSLTQPRSFLVSWLPEGDFSLRINVTDAYGNHVTQYLNGTSTGSASQDRDVFLETFWTQNVTIDYAQRSDTLFTLQQIALFAKILPWAAENGPDFLARVQSFLSPIILDGVYIDFAMADFLSDILSLLLISEKVTEDHLASAIPLMTKIGDGIAKAYNFKPVGKDSFYRFMGCIGNWIEKSRRVGSSVASVSSILLQIDPLLLPDQLPGERMHTVRNGGLSWSVESTRNMFNICGSVIPVNSTVIDRSGFITYSCGEMYSSEMGRDFPANLTKVNPRIHWLAFYDSSYQRTMDWFNGTSYSVAISLDTSFRLDYGVNDYYLNNRARKTNVTCLMSGLHDTQWVSESCYVRSIQIPYVFCQCTQPAFYFSVAVSAATSQIPDLPSIETAALLRNTSIGFGASLCGVLLFLLIKRYRAQIWAALLWTREKVVAGLSAGASFLGAAAKTTRRKKRQTVAPTTQVDEYDAEKLKEMGQITGQEVAVGMRVEGEPLIPYDDIPGEELEDEILVYNIDGDGFLTLDGTKGAERAGDAQWPVDV